MQGHDHDIPWWVRKLLCSFSFPLSCVADKLLQDIYYHKVLLHPWRAGASASRCWLPVHYGEVNALDGYHRPSHHLLKGLPASHYMSPSMGWRCHHYPDRHGSSTVTLKWPHFFSLSIYWHCVRFEASQNAHMSVCEAVDSCTTDPKKWEGWKICY